MAEEATSTTGKGRFEDFAAWATFLIGVILYPNNNKQFVCSVNIRRNSYTQRNCGNLASSQVLAIAVPSGPGYILRTTWWKSVSPLVPGG